MTKDDIIRMAQEAGFREPNPHDGYMGLAYDYRDGSDTGASLERFAALIAAHEREQCAKVCEELERRALNAQNGPPDELSNIMLRHVGILGHGHSAEAIRARGTA